VLAGFIAGSTLGVQGMQLQVYPLHLPLLPLLPMAGILVALLPAAVAPVPRNEVGPRGSNPHVTLPNHSVERAEGILT
jgi:hypothetical protein